MELNLKKILIVEDEPMVRHAIVEVFSRLKDVNVLATKNGKEGLDAAIEEHPDYILSDMVMPIMDGMTMLTMLREDPWGKNANLAFLTNMDEPEKIAEAKAKGVKDFIIKSNMNVVEVVNKIHAKLFEKEAE